MKTKNLLIVFVIYSLLFGVCKAQWVQMSSGMGNVVVYSLAVNTNTIFAGTSACAFPACGGTIYKSTNNGTTWSYTSSLPCVHAFAVNENNVFAGTSGSGVYRSTDSGQNWIQTSLNNEIVYSLAVSGSNVFAGTSGSGVYRSTDNGETWTQTSLNNETVYSLAVRGSNVFAGTSGSGVYRSTDNGQSWTQINEGMGVLNILSLAIASDYIYAGTGGFSVWRRPLVEVIPVELTSFTAVANGRIVELSWVTATEINNQGFEVQRSTSNSEFVTIGFVEGNGTTTEEHHYSFEDKDISGLLCYRLKQVDFDGTYEYSDIVEVEALGNLSFELTQNYPNPFNPITNISYTLPAENQVKLSIHNTLGELVETLVNKKQDAGKYDAVWNAGNHPSGVYIYTLDAISVNGNKQTKSSKKMLLLK